MIRESHISNPYRPFDLISGEWFHHEHLIDEIRNKFNTQTEKRLVVIQGNPGSGKSSLLRRLANHPLLLGKNYLPILLDSKKYLELDEDDLIYSISKDVIIELNKSGYDLPIPDSIKKSRIRFDTFQSLLLLFDSNLSGDEVLILIFDSFDKLLENTDTKLISDFIMLSKYIEKSWSTYGLILAGDKRLINLTNSKVINEFLETAFTINIEEVLEEDSIIELIEQPVKDQLEFTGEALEKIIWYSGKNLYFQQLICYHLVIFLNRKLQDLSSEARPETIAREDIDEECTKEEDAPLYTCTLADVKQTIDGILKENIREFVYTWQNKLPVEDRIIASALADKSITEDTGKGYLFRENKLLENILGETIYMEIEKLHGFGYINPMQRTRHFPKCPFKIPLYGKWIRQEHPFAKTVLENMGVLADRLNLSILYGEIIETPLDKIGPFNKEKIMEIIEKWLALDNEIGKGKTIRQSALKDFFTVFSHLLGVTLREDSRHGPNYFSIDIKNIATGILAEAICFIQDTPEITKEDVINIENKTADFMGEVQSMLSLFFYFHESRLVEALMKKPYLNLVPIHTHDLKQIICSHWPNKIFKKIVLSRLSLHKISPYQTYGPAKTNFYGRSDIKDQIYNAINKNKSYSIVGARKIGKTSLLYNLMAPPPPNVAFVFMSLETEFSGTEDVETPVIRGHKKPENVRSYRTFLKSLESAIERSLGKKVNFDRFFFGKDVSRLQKVIQDLSRKEKRKIVFVFDEIDSLIEYDRKHNFRLIRIFRTLAHENYCQFIFAGFKELYHRKRQIDNPMYNFCKEIILKPLDRESALGLITNPMDSIGVHYKNEDHRDIILEYTGCHPNLLQFFCMQLIEKIGSHHIDDQRTIFKNDIREIFDTTYEEYIMDDVYMFKSDLSNVNKLILIFLTEHIAEQDTGNNEIFGDQVFTDCEIREKLENLDISLTFDDVHRNIRNLVIRFILLDRGKGRYSFALPIFPEILTHNTDRNFKEHIIKEIRKNGVKRVQLPPSPVS